MSGGQSWGICGQVWFDGEPGALAKALTSAGLNVVPGRYAVRLKDCSHFVLVSAADPGCGIFDIDADAETQAEMSEAAERVSSALRQAKIRHDFEVYCHPAKDPVKRFAYDK